MPPDIVYSATWSTGKANVYKAAQKAFTAKAIAKQRTCHWASAQWCPKESGAGSVWVQWVQPTNYRNARQHFTRLLENYVAEESLRAGWEVQAHGPGFSPEGAHWVGAFGEGASAPLVAEAGGASAPGRSGSPGMPSGSGAPPASACVMAMLLSGGVDALQQRAPAYIVGEVLKNGDGGQGGAGSRAHLPVGPECSHVQRPAIRPPCLGDRAGR